MNKTIAAIVGALALFSSIAKANWIEIASLQGYTDNANLLILDFSLSKPETIIVRGLGLSLDVKDHLTDPTIELIDYGYKYGLIAFNNDWSWPGPQDLGNLAPKFPTESALKKDVGAGNYGVILGGLVGTAGVARIEVYQKSVPDTGSTAAMLGLAFILTIIFYHRRMRVR